MNIANKPTFGFSRTKIYGALAVGILFIILGFFIEDRLPMFDEAWRGIRGLAPAGDHDGATSHNLTVGMIIVLLLKELGVAFLVAGIVGWTIDLQAEELNTRHAQELRTAIGNDAVLALFGLSHDKAFIQAIVDTNLKAEVVRRDLELKYIVRGLTDLEARTVLPEDPQTASARFIILEMHSSNTFHNVASFPNHLKIPLAVARRLGKGARAITKATYVKIGEERPLNDDEIFKGIKSTESDDYLSYCWERKLQPSEKIKVVASVNCLKERSDNEVWASFFPTMGDAKIEVHVIPGMNFGVRDVSNGDLIDGDGVPDPAQRSWTLRGPLLRHNSAVIWWRVQEDDAIGGVSSLPPSTAGDMAEQRLPPNEPKGFLRGLKAKLTAS